MRFSIRDLLWATGVVAMGLGWRVDHGWMEDRCEEHFDADNKALQLTRQLMGDFGVLVSERLYFS